MTYVDLLRLATELDHMNAHRYLSLANGVIEYHSRPVTLKSKPELAAQLSSLPWLWSANRVYSLRDGGSTEGWEACTNPRPAGTGSEGYPGVRS